MINDTNTVDEAKKHVAVPYHFESQFKVVDLGMKLGEKL